MGRRYNCRKGEKKGCNPDPNTQIHKDASPSLFRARFAKARRHDGGTTRRFTNFTTDFYLSSEEKFINFSEYLETLIGELEKCVVGYYSRYKM